MNIHQQYFDMQSLSTDTKVAKIFNLIRFCAEEIVIFSSFEIIVRDSSSPKSMLWKNTLPELKGIIHSSLDSFSVNGHLKLTKVGLESSTPTAHTSLYLGIGVPQPPNLAPMRIKSQAPAPSSNTGWRHCGSQKPLCLDVFIFVAVVVCCHSEIEEMD